MNTKAKIVFDMILRQRKGLGDKLFLEVLEQVKEHVRRRPEPEPLTGKLVKVQTETGQPKHRRQLVPSEVRELKRTDPEKHRLLMRIRNALRRGHLEPGRLRLAGKSKKGRLTEAEMGVVLVELAGRPLTDLEKLMMDAGLSLGQGRHTESHYDQLANSLMNARNKGNGTAKGRPPRPGVD